MFKCFCDFVNEKRERESTPEFTFSHQNTYTNTLPLSQQEKKSITYIFSFSYLFDVLFGGSLARILYQTVLCVFYFLQQQKRKIEPKREFFFIGNNTNTTLVDVVFVFFSFVPDLNDYCFHYPHLIRQNLLYLPMPRTTHKKHYTKMH